MHLFLISEVIPRQKRDALALLMHRPAPKRVFSGMAGLIEFGMTACCPLYTIPSAGDNSSWKVRAH